MNRGDAVRIVAKIQAGEGSEEEIDNYIDRLMTEIPSPYISDIIFYPEKFGKGDNLTPEEIVDIAFEYRPFAL